MFSKSKLFFLMFLLMMILPDSVVLAMSRERTEFIESLKKLKSDDVEKNIISQEVIFDIKKKWYAIIIAEKFNNLNDSRFERQQGQFVDLNVDNSRFRVQVRTSVHSNAWVNALIENKNIVKALYEIFDSGEMSSERSLFEIMIEFEKLSQQDARNTIIPKICFSKLEELWDQIDYKQLTDMELIFSHLEKWCTIDQWKVESNKTYLQPLSEKISLGITSFNPKKRILRYLEQLKQDDDNANPISAYHIAMAKKLWYRVASTANADPLFKKNMQELCDKNKWQDCNKDKIDGLNAFFNDNDTLQKLGLLYQAQNEFLAQLKALKEMDSLSVRDASKKITDENVQAIATQWKNINQLRDGCGGIADMDFYIAVRSQFFLETWQPANQAKLIAIVGDKKFNRLRTDLSPDNHTQLPLSFWQAIKLRTRSIIDPYYPSSCKGNVPNVFTQMLQHSLSDLKTSAMTQNAVEEIDGLCNRIMLSKMLYNYTLLDHIIYPFHTSVGQLIKDLKISSEIEINQHFTEVQKKEWIEPQTITEKLKQLRTNLSWRPTKAFDQHVDQMSAYVSQQVIVRGMMRYANKIFPHIFEDKITKFNKSMDNKVNELQRLGRDKLKSSVNIAKQNLDVHIHILKARLRL